MSQPARWHTGQASNGLGNVYVLAAVGTGERPYVTGAELLLARHAIARASMAAAKRLDDMLYEARITGQVSTNGMLRAIALDRLATPNDTEEGRIFDRYSGIDLGENAPIRAVERNLFELGHQWQEVLLREVD